MAFTQRKQPQFYAPDALIAFGTELLRNGGNGTLAVVTLYPEMTDDRRRAAGLSIHLRRQKIVKDMVAAQALRLSQAAGEALERYGATADRTAEEMARLAFSQMRDVVDLRTETDPKDPKKRHQVLRVRDFAEIGDDAHRAIVEVTQRADGTVTIKLGDKLAALNSLARLKGWIADKPTDPQQLVNLIIQR
jgi:hypothetical protein